MEGCAQRQREVRRSAGGRRPAAGARNDDGLIYETKRRGNQKLTTETTTIGQSDLLSPAAAARRQPAELFRRGRSRRLPASPLAPPSRLSPHLPGPSGLRRRQIIHPGVHLFAGVSRHLAEGRLRIGGSLCRAPRARGPASHPRGRRPRRRHRPDWTRSARPMISRSRKGRRTATGPGSSSGLRTSGNPASGAPRRSGPGSSRPGSNRRTGTRRSASGPPVH
jgi:hypothetical protein